MKNDMAQKAANPIAALAGIVRIQAPTIFRAMPHRTAPGPLVVPTPMMAELMMWVVLTGIPMQTSR